MSRQVWEWQEQEGAEEGCDVRMGGRAKYCRDQCGRICVGDERVLHVVMVVAATGKSAMSIRRRRSASPCMPSNKQGRQHRCDHSEQAYRIQRPCRDRTMIMRCMRDMRSGVFERVFRRVREQVEAHEEEEDGLCEGYEEFASF